MLSQHQLQISQDNDLILTMTFMLHMLLEVRTLHNVQSSHAIYEQRTYPARNSDVTDCHISASFFLDCAIIGLGLGL